MSSGVANGDVVVDHDHGVQVLLRGVRREHSIALQAFVLRLTLVT